MHIINAPLPNADGQRAVSAAEVRALVALIRRTAAPRGGERTISLGMMAEALGVSRTTLYSWMNKADKPRPGVIDHGRRIPYTAYYCLQVMATNPAATRDDVFSPMWARIAPPLFPRKAPAPDMP